MVIGLGTGGIKPCVSAFGGDQFKDDQVKCPLWFMNLVYIYIYIYIIYTVHVHTYLYVHIQCRKTVFITKHVYMHILGLELGVIGGLITSVCSFMLS